MCVRACVCVCVLELGGIAILVRVENNTHGFINTCK